MKNYFKFNLTGQKLLPVWLLFLILYLAPLVAIIFKSKEMQPGGDTSALIFIFPATIFLCIIAFVMTFYIAKLVIEGIEYKEQSLIFNGKIEQFVGIFLLGLFLSIITIGIYSPWFVRDMYRFFINNSSHNSNSLDFKGKGGDLFVIILVTYLIPYTFIMLLMFTFKLINHAQVSQAATGFLNLITVFVMIPYTYYMYRWMVNVQFKNYLIRWETDALDACGKIFIETFLTVITIGIYWPVATLKLYRYFAERTIAKGEESKKKFGYDLDTWNDFLLLWGQTLLIIITLGIYYPWGFSKIANRVLGKTYSEDIENIIV